MSTRVQLTRIALQSWTAQVRTPVEPTIKRINTRWFFTSFSFPSHIKSLIKHFDIFLKTGLILEACILFLYCSVTDNCAHCTVSRKCVLEINLQQFRKSAWIFVNLFDSCLSYPGGSHSPLFVARQICSHSNVLNSGVALLRCITVRQLVRTVQTLKGQGHYRHCTLCRQLPFYTHRIARTTDGLINKERKRFSWIFQMFNSKRNKIFDEWIYWVDHKRNGE